MPPRETDRNLLFGTLALQMEFVTRDGLVAAMNARVGDDRRPIGESLVEQGGLTAARRAILEPLVDEHVRAHRDDPAASLAALSSLGGIAADLRRTVAGPGCPASPAEVPVTLAGVLQATHADDPLATRAEIPATIRDGPPPTIRDDDPLMTRADDPYSTRAVAPDVAWSLHPAHRPPAAIRYRKLRQHAAGNLGVVYVARDEELNREVALKEIKERNADHQHSQAKFMLEAEVTGGLEHPGIVPVYGLGHYEDGRPFYAMRFIRGKSLLEAIRRFHDDDALKSDPGARSLALQKLLRRFTDVCNAVGYAHSRGVLHRDLKPDNVMVGQYGETLVVDWGLAKMLGRTEAPGPGGDPDAPPPEGSLQPSSADGLEATYDGSLVGTPAYMSPEQASGHLDRLGPASDIYGLGATLYHLIVGRPSVDARGLRELLAKVETGEIARPRSLAAWIDPALEAICLKAMALKPEGRYATARALADDLDRWIAGEPVAAYPEPFTLRARRWARRHKTPVAIAASLTIASVVALSIGLVLVGRERDRADKNFRQARDAADGFLKRISEDIQLGQPGYQPLRMRLLEKGISYYEQFAREGLDPGDFSGLADAKARVGRMNQLVGSNETARANFRAALDFQEKAARSRPDDPSASRLLVATLGELGDVQLATGRSEDARSCYDRSLEVAGKLAAEHPGDPEATIALANTYSRLGQWQQKAGDRPKGLEFHQKAFGLFETLFVADPTSPRARSDLAGSLARIATVQGEERRPSDALRSYDRAREILEGLVRDNPEDIGERGTLAVVYHDIGGILHGNRQLDEALGSFQRARELREGLVYSNTVVQYLAGLAEDLEVIGYIHLDSNRPDEAIRSYERSRDLWTQLTRSHPTVPEYRNKLAGALEALGRIYNMANQPAEALPLYREARGLLERLVREHPGEADFQHHLANACENLGNLDLAAVGEAEALAAHGRARELRETLIRDHPDDVEYVNALSNSFINLSVFLAKTGHLGEAIDLGRQARDLRMKVVAARPDDFDTRSILALTLENLGVWLEKVDRRPEALDAFRRAVEHQGFALGKAPRVESYRRYLGMHLESLARVQRASNLPAKAASTALERQKLRPDDPEALFQSARELALCIPLSAPAEAEGLAAKAFDALRRAVGLGFGDLNLLRTDKDLDPLRFREDFGRILKEAEEKGRIGATNPPPPKEKP